MIYYMYIKNIDIEKLMFLYPRYMAEILPIRR